MILLLKRGEKAEKSYQEAKAEDDHFRLYKKGAVEFWLVDGDYFIGRIAFRKTKTAGEVVYDVRPTARGKGWGSLMLKLFLERMLPKFKTLEIVARGDNVASIKIIEKNGGIFQRKIKDKLLYQFEQ